MTDSNRTLTGWETVDDEQCRRATSIVELVGRRWSSGIMLALSRGATRFSEIVSTVDGLSDRMASVRLKELEHGGLIERAQQIVDAVRAAPLRLDDGRCVPLSVSVGVATVPDHARTAAELYREADAALYEAKRGGRGRVGRVPPASVPAQAGPGTAG